MSWVIAEIKGKCEITTQLVRTFVLASIENADAVVVKMSATERRAGIDEEVGLVGQLDLKSPRQQFNKKVFLWIKVAPHVAKGQFQYRLSGHIG